MMGFAQLSVFAGYSDLFSRAVSRHGCGAPGWDSVTTRSGILRHPRRSLFGYLGPCHVVPDGGGHDVHDLSRWARSSLIWAPETKGRPLPED